MASRGMTLVEIVVGTAVLVTGGGALLLGMHYTMVHADYLSQFQVALQAAQGELERLTGEDFDTLSSGPEYAGARQDGQRAALDAPELVEAALGVQVKPYPPGTLSPTLLDLHVAACWTSRGRRVGEDQDCDGVLDAGEDADGDGWLDSPAMVSTRVSRRD